MPRRVRRALRRRPRRVRRHRRARKTGMASNNTKVIERVTYRTVQPCKTQTSTTGVGQYAYFAYSPQNSSYANVASLYSEFTAQKTLFDEFRVKSMTVTFRPFYNVLQATQTGTTSQINVYSVIDRDGGTPVSTAVQVPIKMQAYDSCRIFKSTRGWSRTLKMKSWWTDCSQPQVQPNQYIGTVQPWINAGAMQSLILYAEQLPVSAGAVLGEFTISTRVEFRGKKPVAFGLDPASGSVIMTPLESYVPLAIGNPPVTEDHLMTDEYLDVSGGNIVVVSNYDGEVAHAGGP